MTTSKLTKLKKRVLYKTFLFFLYALYYILFPFYRSKREECFKENQGKYIYNQTNKIKSLDILLFKSTKIFENVFQEECNNPFIIDLVILPKISNKSC